MSLRLRDLAEGVHDDAGDVVFPDVPLQVRGDDDQVGVGCVRAVPFDGVGELRFVLFLGHPGHDVM